MQTLVSISLVTQLLNTVSVTDLKKDDKLQLQIMKHRRIMQKNILNKDMKVIQVVSLLIHKTCMNSHLISPAITPDRRQTAAKVD